jgi:hypothetical protein|tara:strand:- start:94 stop:336 length:243 start_codon:yes stop_codon:yes gene_type:complete
MGEYNTTVFDDHGSYAKIGDYVEVIDHRGSFTGTRGIVCEIHHRGADLLDDRRYLRLAGHGNTHFYHDATVRIVSKASDR